MPFTNNNGQTRVGVRISPLVSQVTASTLWNSIYSVYNADSVGSSSLKTSLVASYNGELNTNDSYGSNNGSAVGGLTYSTGKIGNAFQFNGTNAYVSLPTDSWNNTIGGDFSVSVWVNLTNVSSQQNIIGNLSTLNAGWNGWEIRVLSGIPRFNLYRYGSASLISSTTIVANTWYHIVITRKAGVSMSIYVNGSKTTANTITNDPVINATHYPVIGALQYDASKFYYLTSGSKVDGVNIWNRELSESEVVDLYNSGNGSQYISGDFYKPTTSDSLYLNNGTAVGGLTYVPGKVGTAFNFNGTDAYVNMGDVMDIGLSSWSYGMWFNVNNISSTRILFSKTLSGENTGRIRCSVTTGGVIRFAFAPTNTASTDDIDIQTTNTISLNTWYHVVFVLDRTNNMKIYLNGVLQSVTVSVAANNLIPYSGVNFNNINPFRIGSGTGADNTSPNGLFSGQIDAFNVWNRVLTESEITELYNSGNGVQYSNPLSPLLLDSYYGAAAAYSLRKLKNSWTGSAIKVRRSGDNVEQNIGFDAGGNLDTTSLLSFVGANNTALYSEEFDNAWWNKNNVTVTANQAIAPDGTMTADLLSESGTLNHSIFNSTQISWTAGISWSWNMSVYVKKGPGTAAPNTFALAWAGGNIIWDSPYVLFNISTGTIVEVQPNSTDTNFGYSITPVGDGWFRCAMWGTITPATSSNRYTAGVIRFNNNLNTITNAYYTGNTQANMYIWGWQFIRKANDTSVLTTQPYIKTTATAAGNGYVTTWYDQSGNGRNATQSTAANQPQIVSNGSLVLMNNKPSVSFTTSNMTFTQIAGVSGLDIFVVSNFTNVTGGGQNWNIASPILAETSGNVQDFVLGAKGSKMSIWAENNNTIFLQTTSTISINTPYIYNGYGSSTSVGVGFNGGNYVTGSGRRNDLIVRALGKDVTMTAASTQFTGNLSEVIVYTSIQSSNRPNINSEINSYYSIY